jgi:hydroxymethylglutaryl-CoA lyase
MAAHDNVHADATIVVRDVGPRDGFQMETAFVTTEQKIEIVNGLIEARLPEVQVSWFVSPRAVPQLADAAEVLAGIHRRASVQLSVLVPNAYGAERAAAAGVDVMEVFCSTSETHNQRNINRSIDHTLSDYADVVNIARQSSSELRGTISTAFGCPYEGDIPTAGLLRVARAFREDLGIQRITLGDTTDMDTPPLVRSAVNAIRDALSDVEIGLHFHNTRGIGLVIVMVGLAEGVRRYDASVGGLGGCPFAVGATGNVCTEDLVFLLEECGYSTGIDLQRLIEVAQITERVIGRKLSGQVMKAGPRLNQEGLGG